MGNTQAHGYPEAHVRIYKNLLSITSPRTRAEMIQTLLQGPEYVQSFRLSGIYGYMLQYVSRVGRGENPGPLPGEGQQQSQSQQQIQQQKPNGGAGDYSLTHRGASNLDPYQRIMKGKGNEKALSYFQTCLQVLGLEEEVAHLQHMMQINAENAYYAQNAWTHERTHLINTARHFEFAANELYQTNRSLSGFLQNPAPL